MRNLIIAFVSVLGLSGLTACPSGGGEASSREADPSEPPELPVAESVELKSGRTFDCFLRAGELWCRGPAADITNSTDFVLLASGPLLNLEVWDDSVCVDADVLARPQSRTSGRATYCWGEASLDAVYTQWPIVYGGPNFTLTLNGTSDIDFPATSPFVGGDLSLDEWINSTRFADEIMNDGTSLRATSTQACELSGSLLSCEDFELEVGP